MSTLNEIVSERGKVLLCLNNFKFYKQTILKSGEEKWRCENKKCSSVLRTITSGNIRTITFQRTQHNHDALTENELQRKMLGTEAKRKATRNNCKVPTKIFKLALDENSLDGYNKKIEGRISHISSPLTLSEPNDSVPNIHSYSSNNEDNFPSKDLPALPLDQKHSPSGSASRKKEGPFLKNQGLLDDVLVLQNRTTENLTVIGLGNKNDAIETKRREKKLVTTDCKSVLIDEVKNTRPITLTIPDTVSLNEGGIFYSYLAELMKDIPKRKKLSLQAKIITMVVGEME